MHGVYKYVSPELKCLAWKTKIFSRGDILMSRLGENKMNVDQWNVQSKGQYYTLPTD